MKSFDIVIVNWNSNKQLKNCIYSVNKSKKNNFVLNKIIVIDNASTDNSLELLDKSQDNLMIIRNKENLGFGKACNQGAKIAKSDFLLFLNPDTLVFNDTFLNLEKYIYNNINTEIGVYGVQLIDENDNIQKSCARFPNLWNIIVRSIGLNKINNKLFKTYSMEDWNHKSTRYVDHVMGSFYLVQKNIFNKLNGFDEDYFVYIEDLDLSKRIKELGYKSIYIIESKAYHKGGGTSENVKAKRLFYSTRSRLIYAFKHFGLVQGFFLMLFIFTIEPITRMIFLLLKSNFSEIGEMLKGFWLLYKDSLNIIKLGFKK